jgi:hypothetical protein
MAARAHAWSRVYSTWRIPTRLLRCTTGGGRAGAVAGQYATALGPLPRQHPPWVRVVRQHCGICYMYTLGCALRCSWGLWASWRTACALPVLDMSWPPRPLQGPQQQPQAGATVLRGCYECVQCGCRAHGASQLQCGEPVVVDVPVPAARAKGASRMPGSACRTLVCPFDDFVSVYVNGSEPGGPLAGRPAAVHHLAGRTLARLLEGLI